MGIREAIVDYDRYYPTPEPLYLFLKNGKKIGQLKGTQLSEMSKLIEQYCDNSEVAPAGQVKYSSILTQKGSLSQSEVSWCDGIDEQIQNLIKREGLIETGSAHGSAT